MTAGDETKASLAAAEEERRARRLADLEALNAHGERLVQRYGHSGLRPRHAVVGHLNMKRRRRR